MLAPSFFRRWISEKRVREIRKGLRSARLARSPEEWLAMAIFISIVVTIVGMGVTYFLIGYLLKFPLIYSVPLALASGLGPGYGCYRLFLYYPHLSAKNREAEIDDMLSHATAFMLALAKGGYEPAEIFSSLSEREDEYGEVAREAGAVYRNTKLSGYSVMEAIDDVAETTPSEKFKDFLNSFNSTIETSADITVFLSKRTEQYYREAEEQQERNMDMLGIFSEVYVVALGLGPLLGIVMLVLMGMMGQFQVAPIRLLVYLGIPIGTVVFILMLDMQGRTTVEPEMKSLEEIRGGRGNEGWIGKVKRFIESPGRTLIRKPENILFLSVPAAAAFALYGFYSGIFYGTIVVFAFVIGATPYSLVYELGKRRAEKMTEAAPDFLNAFSSAVSSGLSPVRAVKSLPPARFGALEPELRDVKKDITWGSTVQEALSRMSNRISSGLLRWVIRLVERSVQAVSDLSGILDVLARDITLERSLKEERTRVTVAYTMIIYVTFGVFLLTAYNVSTSFLPLLPESAAGGTQPVGGISVGGIGQETIHQLFFRASIIQALCSGLVAGKMGTGEVLSGLKHSVAMLVAAWAVFVFLVF